MPGPKVRLLFGAPLAVMAAALARDPDRLDAGMASAVPRILVAAFVCAGIAWMASSAGDRKAGAMDVVAGLAMSASAAMSLAFAASLGIAASRSGGFGFVTALVMTFFLLLVASSMLILAYVISTMTDVRMGTVALILTCQAVPLAALVFEPYRGAAYGIALAAAAIAAQAIMQRRAAK